VLAAESGAVVLELQNNASVGSEIDYLLASVDPAMLHLAGFAGGDAEDVTDFVDRTNAGAPRVSVTGEVSSGPAGPADVVLIEKVVSDPEPLPERMIEYRIVVTNRGPSPAIQVVVSDSLPEALAYVPVSITVDGVLLTDEDDEDAADFGITAPGTITARLGDMSVGDTVAVTLSARPKQENAGVLVTNTAVVETTSPDEERSNNSADAEIVIKLNTGMETDGIPSQFALLQNYPNPFNPTTTIAFDLPQREFVRLTVVNVLGQPVADLVAGDLDAGRYEVRWDASAASARAASSGLYFYRLEAGSYVATRSMILLK
jgi:uncharacterized repeat protein (TIGR01451 family)